MYELYIVIEVLTLLRIVLSNIAEKGANFSISFVKAQADLTVDMINSKNGLDWKNTKFKNYNFKSLGSNVGGGALHPLMKVRTGNVNF